MIGTICQQFVRIQYTKQHYRQGSTKLSVTPTGQEIRRLPYARKRLAHHGWSIQIVYAKTWYARQPQQLQRVSTNSISFQYREIWNQFVAWCASDPPRLIAPDTIASPRRSAFSGTTQPGPIWHSFNWALLPILTPKPTRQLWMCAPSAIVQPLIMTELMILTLTPIL